MNCDIYVYAYGHLKIIIKILYKFALFFNV